MTVASHAQQNQIKAREAVGIALKAVAQKIFVSLGGPSKLRPLRLHAVNVSRRNGNAQQQFGARHSELLSGSSGGTARSSPQYKCTLAQSTWSRYSSLARQR